MVAMPGAPREFDFLRHPGGVAVELGDHLGDPRTIVLFPLLARFTRNPGVSYRGFLIGHRFRARTATSAGD
jgi:hypothetical protein